MNYEMRVVEKEESKIMNAYHVILNNPELTREESLNLLFDAFLIQAGITKEDNGLSE